MNSFERDDQGFVIPRPEDFLRIQEKYAGSNPPPVHPVFADEPGSGLFPKGFPGLLVKVLIALLIIIKIGLGLFFWFAIGVAFPLCNHDRHQYSDVELAKLHARIQFGLVQPSEPPAEDDGGTVIVARRQSVVNWTDMSRPLLNCSDSRAKGFSLDKLNYDAVHHVYKFKVPTSGEAFADHLSMEETLDFCYGKLTARQAFCWNAVYWGIIRWSSESRTEVEEHREYRSWFLGVFIASCLIPFFVFVCDYTGLRVANHSCYTKNIPTGQTWTAYDVVEHLRERSGVFCFVVMEKTSGDEPAREMARKTLEILFPEADKPTVEAEPVVWEDATEDFSSWPRSRTVSVRVRNSYRFPDAECYQKVVDEFDSFYKRFYHDNQVGYFTVYAMRSRRPGTEDGRIVQRGPRPLKVLRNKGQFNGENYQPPTSFAFRLLGSDWDTTSPSGCGHGIQPYRAVTAVLLLFFHLDLLLSLYGHLFLAEADVTLTKLVGRRSKRAKQVCKEEQTSAAISHGWNEPIEMEVREFSELSGIENQ